MKVKALASGNDGVWNFVQFCGGEDEVNMGGGFFQSFEEGVEGGFGEHVNFVDDVNFLFGEGGGKLGFFNEVANIVN